MTTVVSPMERSKRTNSAGRHVVFPERLRSRAARAWSGPVPLSPGLRQRRVLRVRHFSITDWISQTRSASFRETCNCRRAWWLSARGEVYIVQGKVPKLGAPFRNANLEPSQLTHKYRLGQPRRADSPAGKSASCRRRSSRFRRRSPACGWTSSPAPAGDALASELGRVAVLHEGTVSRRIFGAHGRVEMAEFGPGDVSSSRRASVTGSSRSGRCDSNRHPVQQSALHRDLRSRSGCAATGQTARRQTSCTAEAIDKLPRPHSASQVAITGKGASYA